MPGYKVFDDDYHFLFNSYYETEQERWIRTDRRMLTRPWVNDILQYRAFINEHMKQFLTEQGLPEELNEAFEIGLNHEQQHQEFMVYDIKHILGINPLAPVYGNFIGETTNPDLTESYLEVPADIHEVRYDGEGFHFDNEERKHRVFLESYRVLDRLNIAGEYIEFIEWRRSRRL